jgi:hypothetical protein
VVEDLVPTVVEVPLTSDGLAQSGDPKIVKPGTPITLENLRFDRFGRLEGRRGFSRVFDAGTGMRCQRLIAVDAGIIGLLSGPVVADEQVNVSETGAYQRRPDGTWEAAPTYEVPLVSNVERRVLWAELASSVVCHALAVGEISGEPPVIFSVVQMSGTPGMRGRFFSTDGTLLSELPLVADAANPRVVWDPDNQRYLVLATTSSTNGSLRVWQFTDDELVATAWPTPVAVFTDCRDGPLDVSFPTNGETVYYVIYTTQSAGTPNGIRVAALRKSNQSELASHKPVTSGTYSAVAAHTDGRSFAFVLASSKLVYVCYYSSDIWGGSPTIADLDEDGRRVTFGQGNGTGYCTLYYDYAQTVLANGVRSPLIRSFLFSDMSSFGVVSNAYYYGVELASAPVSELAGSASPPWNDHLLAMCGMSDSPVTLPEARQFHHVLLSNSDNALKLVANLQQDERGILFDETATSTNDWCVRGVSAAGRHWFPATETGPYETKAKGVMYSYAINGPNVAPWTPETHPSVAALGGGIVCGLKTFGASEEHVPVQYPSLSAESDGGSVTGRTGTFYYQACFVTVDELGRMSRGPMSLQVSHAATAEGTIVYFGKASCSRAEKLYVELYRSDDGRLYHYVYRTNVLSYASYWDYDLAGAFDTQPAPYTESGEPSHFCPPWSDAICRHANRLFSANGRRVYYSHWLEANETPQWTGVGYFECPDSVVGLATFGGNLILLSENSLWYVSGDGPDRLMSGSFDAPRLLSDGVGLSKRYGGERSVLSAAGSLWFRSERTIERMSGGEPEPVGDQVRDILAQYPRVRDVCHVPAQYAIYWSLGPEDVTADDQTRAVVRYDYLHNSWSTVYGQWWSVVSGPLQRVEGKLIAGVDAYSESSAAAIWEETDEYFDVLTAGTEDAFYGTIEFAPFRPFGNGGRGWIRKLTLLGEHRDKAIVLLQVKDDAIRFSTPDYYTQGFTSDDTTGKILEREHSLLHPFGGMVQIKLTLQASTDEDGELPFLSALSLEVDQLPGAKKLRYSRKF